MVAEKCRGAIGKIKGFATYKRTDLDEEGNPYPLLYMRSEERERGE